MLAIVHLIYKDQSENCFEFRNNEPQDMSPMLQIVCRGALWESLAVRVVAYNEDGLEIYSHEKNSEYELTRKMFRG